MLRGEFPDAGEQSPDELLSAYESVLAAAVDRLGVDEVTEETGLDRATVAAIGDGDAADVSLETAAAVLATDPDRPDAGTIQAEAQDILLMGMTTAVLDVEAVASGIDEAMDAKEIQQKIEGRYPITLAEYACLHSHIEGEQR